METFKYSMTHSTDDKDRNGLLGLIAAIEDAQSRIPGVTSKYVELTKGFAEDVYCALVLRTESGRPWLYAYPDLPTFQQAYAETLERTLRSHFRTRKNEARTVLNLLDHFDHVTPGFLAVFPIIEYPLIDRPLEEGYTRYQVKLLLPDGHAIPIIPEKENPIALEHDRNKTAHR